MHARVRRCCAVRFTRGDSRPCACSSVWCLTRRYRPCGARCASGSSTCSRWRRPTCCFGSSASLQVELRVSPRCFCGSVPVARTAEVPLQVGGRPGGPQKSHPLGLHHQGANDAQGFVLFVSVAGDKNHCFCYGALPCVRRTQRRRDTGATRVAEPEVRSKSRKRCRSAPPRPGRRARCASRTTSPVPTCQTPDRRTSA